MDKNDKGAVVTGSVKEVDAKGAIVTLIDGVEAVLKGSELSREKVEDVRTELSIGGKILF